jgi:hypothetical protein
VKHYQRIDRLNALTLRQYHQRIDVELGQLAVEMNRELRHAHERIGERIDIAAGLPRKPRSSFAPFTSAIISTASLRVIGQWRSATSL